ncbi:molybdopterin-dependent oxidoreductase [candidate division KSB1 bacterium]|nr:molybdopterin-dependent oxidoreductase [candidate division KSB1 bacterium]
MPTQVFASVCTMDCPDTCSLEVEVTDGRVVNIKGTSRNPVTDDFICSKVAQYAKRVYSKDRLLSPMRRVGKKGEGRFERISWEQALNLICEQAQAIRTQWGGEAILPYSYGGSNGVLGQDTTDKAFFAKLGASRLERAVCAVPASAAAMGVYGKMAGVAFEDYVHARGLIIWGANPKASNIHLVPYLKQAKAAGAKIAIVDPMCNFSQREIDLHVPVFPGADLAVALAMIHYWHEHDLLDWNFIAQHTSHAEVLLEKAQPYTLQHAAAIARIDAGLIERLAVMYAEADPALIRLGWGMERNRNGAQAIAAVLAMPALLGKFGKRGGGYTLSNSGAYRFNEAAMVASEAWNTRVINMNLLGKVLLEEHNPPIKMLFVYNCNPVAITPNQNAVLAGLQREDLFTIVFEQVMTDTASYADVLLPAVTFLEQNEIKKAYGSYALQYSAPVIPALGEAKPNEEVFAMLGRAMGWNDAAFAVSTNDLLPRAAQAMRGMGKEISWPDLQQNKIAFFDFPGAAPIQFQTVFPHTADRKANLAPDNLREHAYEYLDGIDGNPAYPLALISPATDKSINSTMAEYNLPELYLMMHPVDAAARHLREGEKVAVRNQYGEVHCRLQISAEIRTGVVLMPKGAWRKASLNGRTANALAPDTLCAVGGACFNDARVEVKRL